MINFTSQPECGAGPRALNQNFQPHCELYGLEKTVEHHLVEFHRVPTELHKLVIN